MWLAHLEKALKDHEFRLDEDVKPAVVPPATQGVPWRWNLLVGTSMRTCLSAHGSYFTLNGCHLNMSHNKKLSVINCSINYQYILGHSITYVQTLISFKCNGR
jgi:hypothetical protein